MNEGAPRHDKRQRNANSRMVMRGSRHARTISARALRGTGDVLLRVGRGVSLLLIFASALCAPSTLLALRAKNFGHLRLHVLDALVEAIAEDDGERLGDLGACPTRDVEMVDGSGNVWLLRSRREGADGVDARGEVRGRRL